jgi:hypothetical protein
LLRVTDAEPVRVELPATVWEIVALDEDDEPSPRAGTNAVELDVMTLT